MCLFLPWLSAAGGKPQFTEKFDDSGGPFLNPGVSAVCGFDVLCQFHERGKLIVFEDGTVRLHFNSEYI